MDIKFVSLLKKPLRVAYKYFNSLFLLSSLILCPRAFRHGVFFAGALAGNNGGGLVKVQRLKKYFQERRFNFRIIYSLSNCPYLTKNSLKISKKKEIAIIHNQNGVFYPSWFKGDWALENRRMASFYHLADYVFWQSEFCKISANKFLGIRDGPGEILYNAVDLRHFKPATSLETPEIFTFLINGKIDAHLAYRLLLPLEAICELNSSGIHCNLIVAGTIESDIIKQAQEITRTHGCEKQLSFLGPYSQEIAPQIYSQANAVIMLKQNDPCPNTVIEAMASGLPIIYSNNGGLPELVGTDCGFPIEWELNYFELIFPSVREIALALEKAIFDDQKKAICARKKALKFFDIENWIRRHRQIFEEFSGEKF